MARLPRTSAAPVDIRDAAGARLLHLTQHESSSLLAAGLYRLLRGILDTLPDAANDTDLTPATTGGHRRRAGARNRSLALLRSGGDGHHLEYRSHLAPGIPGHHLVVDTGPGIGIRRMYPSTDCDARRRGARRAAGRAVVPANESWLALG